MYETHGTACNFVHKRIIGAVTGGAGALFSGGNPLAGAVRGFAGGGSSRGAPKACGGGMVSDGRGGCVRALPRFTGSDRGSGLGGSAFIVDPSAAFPGGRPLFSPAGGGVAVMGQWGAALEPEVVGSVARADGSVGAILRCIRGMVLGTDDLCYNKPLANGKRKWPRPTPPFLSGGDVKCLRRSIRLRKSKSSKKLLRELGMG